MGLLLSLGKFLIESFIALASLTIICGVYLCVTSNDEKTIRKYEGKRNG